jgi:hypothetical protein
LRSASGLRKRDAEKWPARASGRPLFEPRVQSAPPISPPPADSHSFWNLATTSGKGRDGDRINAVLAAAGYNFGLLLRWFEALLRALFAVFCRGVLHPQFA